MLEFEIDGHLFTVQVHEERVESSIPFVTPDGVTYWMEAPTVA